MHYLSSVYFITQPLHDLGMFVDHHQEVYCKYTIGMCCIFTVYVTPDDGLQIFPKLVDVDWLNKLRINSASSSFLLHRYNLTVIKILKESRSHCVL